MSSTPPPPLDPQDPRAADPTNPASWLILGGLLLGGALIGTITLLNSFSSKPTPPVSTRTTPAPSTSDSPLPTPGGSYKLIFEGSGDGTITNPASNRQNFAGATAHVQWHLEYVVSDGSASAADVPTATITGTGQYRTYDGTGTCNATATGFGDYPELRSPRTPPTPSDSASVNTFLFYPPLGSSYALSGTCPAFTAAFGAAKDFQFTLHLGVDRIPIPTQSFDQTLFLPGPRHMTLTWSGSITVSRNSPRQVVPAATRGAPAPRSWRPLYTCSPK